MRLGKIYLSCGHQDEEHPNGWPLTTKCTDRYLKNALRHEQVCSECFAWWLTEMPYMLCSTEQQQKDYLEA